MDFQAFWPVVIDRTNSGWRAVRAGTVAGLDTVSPLFVPLVTWWDQEAARREALRTPENLKALIEAQRAHGAARATASQARAQRSIAKRQSKNPLSGQRRAARVSHRAARAHHDSARDTMRMARKRYPSKLRTRALQAHLTLVVLAALAVWVLSVGGPLDLTPAWFLVALFGAHGAAQWLGRRTLTPVAVADGLSIEERQLVERLDPSYWVQHAEERGLSGTVTTPPVVTTGGIECDIRLDGQWTVKKLRASSDAVRALLGVRTDVPMMVGPGPRGGWGIIRLRTRSAAPDGAIPWHPGDALGVDMVTGEEVDVPLGHRMLIAGMSGSGKSTASRPLLFKASEGPENVLVIIDLKQVEGRLWDHRARVASTPISVLDLVQELVDEQTERLAVLPKGQATLVPTAERPRITVVVDEGAEVMTNCAKVEVLVGWTENGRPIYEKRNALVGLDSIARMGRAACIDLWWMTQSPTYGDGVPRQIAKQLGTRIGLAVESPTEARVVFGESAQAKGWLADELPMPGVAMIRDGKRTPDPVKVRYITDAQVIAMSDQPIWSRAEVEDAARGLRLVPDLVGDLADEDEDDSVYVTPADAVPADAIPADAVPAPRPAGGNPTDAAVVDAVRALRPPVRQTDVVEVTKLPKGTVSKAVKRLVEAGVLTRHEDGSLSIATATEVAQ